MLRWLKTVDRRAAITALGIAAAAIAFALLAFHRRWLADDGLIVVRTVRQILEGNGPVYSAFERAEANTSTVWTYLLALVSFVTRARVAHVAVYTGIACAVAALVIGLDGARRFLRMRGHREIILPAGAFVMLGVYPFWDYATSGLENGLCLAWLAISWWHLVTLDRDHRRHQHAFAIVVGLGPLVRPELALVTIVFLCAGWSILRPPWRRTLALVALAGALPVAYEIFRAGYYGTLVPLPALTKSATRANWPRGFGQLREMMVPYKLALPLGVFAIMLGVALARRQLDSRARAIVLAPVISSVLVTLYLVRVGGDFMHGRMWLSSLFLIVLPAFALPVTRRAAPVLAVLAIWGIATGVLVQSRAGFVQNPLVGDERLGYIAYTKTAHPTDEDPFVARVPEAAKVVDAAVRDRTRLVVTEAGPAFAMNANMPAPVAVVVGRLGVGGALAPLDGIVVDTFGLANPLGARITMTQPKSQPGHQKALPWAWVLADFADPAVITDAERAEVAAARHALTCGDLAELMASVREPMSPSRFWANLTGSLRRTRLVIPHDPFEAERTFCK